MMRTSTLDADLVGYGGGPSGAAPARSPQQIFVGILLVVIGMLFMLLTVAYLGRSQFDDWRALADTAEPLANPWRLWINTALLALGSAALHWARSAQAHDRPGPARVRLAAAGVLGVAFLVGQLTVWQDLVAGGHLVDRNPANSFFYLITGLHGAHLGIGLLVLALVGANAWRRAPPGRGQGLQLCSWYWDFLLVLWLAMFALVASSGESLDAFAAFCGMR
jgi:cytochrome c oxidase subunit 3